ALAEHPGTSALGHRERVLTLAHIQLRGKTALVARPRQVQRLLPDAELRFRDTDLSIQIEQLEVGAGHLAHYRQDHASSPLLAGQQYSEGRLVQPAQPSPEIQLPIESDTEESELIR